jgi:hypothetical protein
MSPDNTALFGRIGQLMIEYLSNLVSGNVNNGLHRLFAASSLLGLSHDYPELTTWLRDNLNPTFEAEFRKAEKQCIASDSIYIGKDIGKYFKRGLNALLDPIPQEVIKNTTVMGLRGAPKEPWYLYQVGTSHPYVNRCLIISAVGFRHHVSYKTC